MKFELRKNICVYIFFFIYIGFSILQGGPLPCFMNENLIRKLLGVGTGNDLTKAEQQFQDGLAKFGIVEVR